MTSAFCSIDALYRYAQCNGQVNRRTKSNINLIFVDSNGKFPTLS